MGWAIALHGGAGDIPLSLPPERRQPREEALRHCLRLGVEALKAKMPPLDVVELVVRLIILIIAATIFSLDFGSSKKDRGPICSLGLILKYVYKLR